MLWFVLGLFIGGRPNVDTKSLSQPERVSGR